MNDSIEVPVERIRDLKNLRGIGYIPDQIYDEELNYIPQIREDLKPHLTSSSINAQLRMTLAGRGVYVLLGTGGADHEQALAEASSRHRHFVFLRGFSDRLAQPEGQWRPFEITGRRRTYFRHACASQFG